MMFGVWDCPESKLLKQAVAAYVSQSWYRAKIRSDTSTSLASIVRLGLVMCSSISRYT